MLTNRPILLFSDLTLPEVGALIDSLSRGLEIWTFDQKVARTIATKIIQARTLDRERSIDSILSDATAPIHLFEVERRFLVATLKSRWNKALESR